MAIFVKKLRTGRLVFQSKKGKRLSVGPGEMVECDRDDIPINKLSDFDEISPEAKKGKKPSLLESETERFQSQLFLSSWILNPEWKPPLHKLVFTPCDLIGLKSVLYDLEQTEIACRVAYGDAWKAWKHQCDIDPMHEKRKNIPQSSHYIEPIARTTAALNHTLEEKKEVIRRIKNLDKDGLSESIQRRKKMFMKGILRRSLDRSGRFREVDGYDIEYRDDKPFIPELNKWLRTYIDEVKVYKITKGAAKSEKSSQEFLDNRREKRIRATKGAKP